jgi:hypothetical protein
VLVLVIDPGHHQKQPRLSSFTSIVPQRPDLDQQRSKLDNEHDWGAKEMLAGLINCFMRMDCLPLFRGQETREQTFNVDRCRHGLETSSIWMQEIAGAADRGVRLECR